MKRAKATKPLSRERRADLSVSEVAALRHGGFELAPSTVEVSDVLARTAAEYAELCKIPIFQLEDGRLLPGLEEILAALPEELHPIAVCNWFMTPNVDLVPKDLEHPLSPREWLLAGRSPKTVAELAADLDIL